MLRLLVQAFRDAFQPTGDTTCIHKFWDAQRASFPLSLTFDIVEAFGTFLTIPAVFTLCEMYGWHFVESKVMATAFAVQLGTNFLEFTVRAGERGVTDWLTGPSWNLHADQLRSITLSYIQQQGQFTWLFAMDELLLGIALLAAAVLGLSRRPGLMPAWFSWLSVVIGVIAIINFGLELGRLGAWQTLSLVAGITAAAVGFILFPIWLIAVGCYLEVYAPSDSRGAPLMDEPEGDHSGLSTSGVGLATEEPETV